jgi:TPR repeat protein
VERNDAVEVEYFRKVAEQDVAEAQRALADARHRGLDRDCGA